MADCTDAGPMLIVEANLPPGSDGGEAVRVKLSALTRAMLDETRPTLVVCPLFGDGVDAMQVVERLAELGWTGRVCALSHPLPNPELVRAEVQSLAPGICFDLFELP